MSPDTGSSAAAEIDEAALRAHIGTTIADADVITAYPPKALIVTFDRDETPPAEGDPLPPGWHTLFFLGTPSVASLGPDGLALSGGVLPEIPLPRRMFAGTGFRFHQPLCVGDTVRRETELTDITVKRGRTGLLVFTTLTMRYHGPNGLAVEEDRNGVFREEVPAGAGNPATRRTPPPSDVAWRRTITPDPVMLFRYSALTFNGHRIHYDRPYAAEVEGYPGLVVHGPLVMTLLLDFARDNMPGRAMRSFAMRAMAPLFDTAPFELVGRPTDEGCEVFAVTPEGGLAMRAQVGFHE